jgi:hypothetical protein
MGDNNLKELSPFVFLGLQPIPAGRPLRRCYSEIGRSLPPTAQPATEIASMIPTLRPKPEPRRRPDWLRFAFSPSARPQHARHCRRCPAAAYLHRKRFIYSTPAPIWVRSVKLLRAPTPSPTAPIWVRSAPGPRPLAPGPWPPPSRFLLTIITNCNIIITDCDT